MSEPLITIDRITVRIRDRWLLEGATWNISAGEQWMVVGPNGAGKTTLVKAVAGLLPVVQGKIHYHFIDDGTPTSKIAYVAGDARRELWRRESDLNYGRAFAGRFGAATTARQLIVQSVTDNLPSSELRLFVDEVSDNLKLQKLLNRPVMSLSFGEMSRILIARELIRRPKMLILDEPFDGLDLVGQHELKMLLNRLAVAGLPIVLVTHRQEEMLPATTHAMTIEKGRIIKVQRIERAEWKMDANDRADRQENSAVAIKREPVCHHTGRKSLSDPLIDMHSVTVRFDDLVVLDRLTWSVSRGENWAITGPNGAGKSTLLKLITGDCLQVYANRIRLFGKRRGTDQSLWEIREKLGVVSPDMAMAYQKQMSALDVVCSGFFDSVGLYRHCDLDQIASARALMDDLAIAACAATPFNRLSQGQRQMVLIARAMVKRPDLLILDEPCAGLDPDNRCAVLDLLANIGSRQSTGLIFVSHHHQEIPDCMTHQLVLERGRVNVCGPIRHLYPKNKCV